MATTKTTRLQLAKQDQGDEVGAWAATQNQGYQDADDRLMVKSSDHDLGGTLLTAVVFTGVGLDDMSHSGTYTGTRRKKFRVEIDATGTPDTFRWSDDGGQTWTTGVSITGAAQLLGDGVSVTFVATTGHTLADLWDFFAEPVARQDPNDIDGAGAALADDYEGQRYLDETDLLWWVGNGSNVWTREVLIQSGLAANRQTNPLVDGEIYVATDTGVISKWNASTYAWDTVEVDSYAEAAGPVSSQAGLLKYDTNIKQLYRDNGASLDLIRPLPILSQGGCEIEWTDADTFVVKAGEVRDIGDNQNLVLTSDMSKEISGVDGAWSAGAAGNAMPSSGENVGLSPDTWYRVFMIGGPTVAADWGLDLLSASAAANLLAAAGAGYTRYRRRGYVRFDGSSNLVQWLQDEDDFWWETPQVGWDDAGVVNYFNGGSGLDRVLDYAPPEVIAHLAASVTSFDGVGGQAVLVTRTGVTIGTVADNAAPGMNLAYDPSGIDLQSIAAQMFIRTDASRQIHVEAVNAGDTFSFHAFVHGWKDHRRN